MKLQAFLIVLTTLAFSTGCRSAMPAARLTTSEVTVQRPLELTIKPAAASASAGQRLPLRFTIRNPGDQPVHMCLSSGRVVHLWGLDRKYAYTIAEQGEREPSCAELFDLEPHGERSWNEDIAIPAIEASAAKIVGFAQVVPRDCSSASCAPLWLSAAYSPFTIEAPAAAPARLLDLRTGAVQALINPRDARPRWH